MNPSDLSSMPRSHGSPSVTISPSSAGKKVDILPPHHDMALATVALDVLQPLDILRDLTPLCSNIGQDRMDAWTPIDSYNLQSPGSHQVRFSDVFADLLT